MFHEDTQAVVPERADGDEAVVPPKTAFVLGFATAILSVGTLGFIIRMYVVLNA